MLANATKLEQFDMMDELSLEVIVTMVAKYLRDILHKLEWRTIALLWKYHAFGSC